MKRKVSIRDIATSANVSTATVSYVLNGQENRVGPEVARKVKAIAEKLNYRPDYIARSLKTKKTNTIGLVVANITYRFTTGITRAIEAEAKKQNYTVLIGSSDESLPKFKELINVLIDRQVDGLILLPVEDAREEIESLTESGIPFVLMDRYFPELSTNFIALDNYRAAYDAVKYLADLEHTHIGFINYKTSMFHLQERTRGFADALKKLGLPAGSKWIKKVRRESFEEDVEKAIDQVLAEKAAKPAIVFASDTLALKGISYLTSLKKDIPEDISVLSFDGSEAFQLYRCPVSHGLQPLEEMGKLSVQTLLNVMNNGNINRQLLLKSGFVPGRSCGEQEEKIIKE